jgi:hypothetical protein
MKRWLVLTSGALAIISVALLIMGIFLQPATLARKTVTIDQTAVDFRITQSGSLLYASAVQQRMFSTGWSTTVLIGSAEGIGTNNPEIVDDEQTKQVCLRVGKAILLFDPPTKSFLFFDEFSLTSP